MSLSKSKFFDNYQINLVLVYFAIISFPFVLIIVISGFNGTDHSFVGTIYFFVVEFFKHFLIVIFINIIFIQQ
jgi:hypothetical protein